jgi:acetyltransferase-like isoleucine patch superfamily enzyme
MYSSHGSGRFSPADFSRLGANVVFEDGVLAFHPDHIEIGAGVYVGHYAILHGHHSNGMVISDGTWIGPQSFLHSAGGLTIGRNVGIGPGVKILTSSHRLDRLDTPILHSELDFAPVEIDDGCDVGVGAVILPGVRIGRYAQVAAGAVVASNVDDYAIVGGVPARLIRMRR